MSSTPASDAASKVDIGILTIRDDEFRAVLAVFPDKVGTRGGARRTYTVRRADAGGGEHYRIAVLRLIEQGQGEAQDAARDLIEDLAPRLVLVVGIAVGRPSDELTLGDVVVSTRFHDFTVEARKAGKAPEYDVTGGPINKALAARVANLAAREDDLGDWTADLPSRPPVIRTKKRQLYGTAAWQRDLREKLATHHGPEARPRAPRYACGPIASSDRVVKDPALLIAWLEAARSLLAVEMESGGVYRAARDRCPMLAIRGISDIVGLKRTDAWWTKYACASAAAFARAFLRTRPIELGSAASGDDGDQGPRPDELAVASPRFAREQLLRQRLSKFVDREAEMRRFCSCLDGRGKPVMVVQGDGGLGKSFLLARMISEVAKRGLSMAEVVPTDMCRPEYLEVMRKIRDDLRKGLGLEHFNPFTDLVNFFYEPQYTRQLTLGSDVSAVTIKDSMFSVPRSDRDVPWEERRARITDAFVGDLARVLHSARAVLFFDAIEKMPPATRSWMSSELIDAVANGRLASLRVVLLGRCKLELSSVARDIVDEVELQPLGRPHIVEYLDKRGIRSKAVDELAGAFLASSRGNPLDLAMYVDAYLRLEHNRSDRASAGSAGTIGDG